MIGRTVRAIGAIFWPAKPTQSDAVAGTPDHAKAAQRKYWRDAKRASREREKKRKKAVLDQSRTAQGHVHDGQGHVQSVHGTSVIPAEFLLRRNDAPLSLGKVKKEREVRAQATRLPPTWRPTAEDIRFATEHGFDPVYVEQMALKFKDHWGGRPEVRSEWSGIWRNWVRNERPHQAQLPLYASIRGGKGQDPSSFSEAEWRTKFAIVNEKVPWPKAWGPPPGAPGCLMPEPLQRELLATRKAG